MSFDAKIPQGDLANKWYNHKFDIKLVNPSNKKIGLLGAGGSSRALLAGLSENGASEILICNRTKEKATKLEIEFSRMFPKIKIKSVSLEKIEKSYLDLLVNTTSVGMQTDKSLIDLSLYKNKKHVIDIIYNPLQTKLLRQAENLSIPNLNGLSFLLPFHVVYHLRPPQLPLYSPDFITPPFPLTPLST